jgi:3-phenylpropionate/trans-cinnamate dioxygenase ferredoxin reductase subunit
MAGIVIIGAGECGIRAAFAARDAGYEGAITVVGDEQTLPYERPPLSKPDASGAVEKPIMSPAYSPTIDFFSLPERGRAR